ncbi:uncharacterized protein LOC110035026 isoform X1 [Phalaenopsis equestris]|uniref:uncharacterized protein LOC110035026 isoform X1 n=1 Tax=Phalaenopsis equestris TaxID=78828 RepID=UPI0009E59B42|nr:uncharacterized protein LOC110035026 isoform X1 [Phalaenopsis equestris]
MVPSKNTEEVSQNGCGENTQVEEKEWLASLSEHELDFLISLKDLATTRAKNIGHEGLTQKFDLKVLRALAFVLLEYFKDRLINIQGVPADKLLASLSDCRLLDLNYDGNPDTITSASKSSNKDISFVSSKRKRMWDGLKEDASFSNKKQKNTDGA